VSALRAEAPPSALCDPWWTVYDGDHVTGQHVVGYWPFDSADGTDDASGKAHALSLEDARIHAAGRFGGCLESFPGWPVEDRRHRARTPSRADLSPPGPFTLEMWICPKLEMDADYPDSFLLDKKYVAHDDYQLILGKANRTGTRVLRACLGFGADSSTWYSRPAKFEVGVWRHVAFTYDGDGTGAFYLDGVPWGRLRIAGRRSVSPGRHPLSIGDRIGSYYHGFPGYLDQVRICRGVREFRRVGMQRVGERSCFVRMEANASLAFRVTNLQRVGVDSGRVAFSLDGDAGPVRSIGGLAPGAWCEVSYRLDTRLRPDRYTLTATLELGDVPAVTETFDVTIVPRDLPHSFPVVMWGVYGGVDNEFDRLEEIGFTHALGVSADFRKIWQAGGVTEPAAPDKVASAKRMLDAALARGLRVSASLSPGAALRGETALQRVDREGKPIEHRPDICGLLPALRPYCRNVGASVARAYGEFPAFDSALIHTEVRGHARPCFHPRDLAAFRDHAGFDIPPEVVSQRGVESTRLDEFPADRVIPDDHPLYVYYRWYWKHGDGWNELNSAVHEGLRSTGRADLWTWHDPAVRVASVYGSGGRVDVLSQWTYSYPDPIRIGLATDELLAMAAAADPPQRVMKMTQIIWYRSQTAPASRPGEAPPTYRARWEREQPDAPFITIAPMHLREALWTKIARPIEGIMYHRWQSLVPCDGPSSYRFTHPQTRHELARLIREVVRPLGPTLRQVPGVRSDVALLESFASEMFARRGTYGWNGGWAGDAYHALVYAGQQPEIVFDESIVSRGLDGYRVLVMPDCDVITRSMAERIREFQKKGGVGVGDERLCPAIRPEIRLTSYRRTGKADRDKAALLAIAADLRRQLGAHTSRRVRTSDPEVVPYLRRHGASDYVFVVNDHREFGSYVGHHGIVMENGVPAAATVTVRRNRGAVYDLVEHRRVPDRIDAGQLVFDTHLGPCDGRVYLVTPEPIATVRIDVPPHAVRGAAVSCAVEILDAAGRPIDAVVPVELDIRDAEGRPAEGSGFYGAASGRVEIALDIAPNEPTGTWWIRIRELADGRSATAGLRVAADGSSPATSADKPVPEGVSDPVQPRG